VSKIVFGCIPNSLFAEFAAMKRPFPELTTLLLWTIDPHAPVLPESFLDGSARRLKKLQLYRIKFPTLPKLVLTATDLIQLDLDIPVHGYILPEEMATSLATLKRLKFLSPTIRYPVSQADGTSRHPPSLTPVVLPALIYLYFHGDSNYLEVIVSGIDAPTLRCATLSFLQPVFDTPLLRRFISRTVASKLPQRAKIFFDGRQAQVDEVSVTLRRQKSTGVETTFDLQFKCTPRGLSPLIRLCSSSLPPLSSFEYLEVYQDRGFNAGEMENAQWLEFFRSFSSVKDLAIPCKKMIRLVAPALVELAGKNRTDVFPVLQNLFLDLRDLGPVRETIDQFIAMRKLSGRPVVVHRATYFPFG
jgi:hypothetical protein